MLVWFIAYGITFFNLYLRSCFDKRSMILLFFVHSYFRTFLLLFHYSLKRLFSLFCVRASAGLINWFLQVFRLRVLFFFLIFVVAFWLEVVESDWGFFLGKLIVLTQLHLGEVELCAFFVRLKSVSLRWGRSYRKYFVNCFPRAQVVLHYMFAVLTQLLKWGLRSASYTVVPEEKLYLEVVREPGILLDRVWIHWELCQFVVAAS